MVQTPEQFLQITPQPIKQAVSVAQMMPVQTLSGVYRLSSQLRQSTLEQFELAPSDDAWVLTIPTHRQVHLMLNAAGDLATDWEKDLFEEALVEYEPALVLAPAMMASEVQRSGEVAVTIKTLDGGRVRDQGRCRFSTQVLGSAKMSTAAGEFEVYRVREERHMDLGLADVTVVIEAAYAVGQGTVAESQARQTRMLGLFTTEIRESLLRWE